MALTIPTSELTGLLADVLAFVDDAKGNPHRGVLVAWDNENSELSASAYDVLSGARSTWIPDEGQEGDANEEENDERDFGWGGNEHDWQVFIGLDDAKEIVKVFKLPAKKWWVPLTIKVNPTGSRLTVERTGDHGPTEALQSVRTDPDALANLPDIRRIASDAVADDGPSFTDVMFSPYRLAAFGTVRAHGPLELTFTDGPAVATMGTRFQGFIFPADSRKAEAQAQATSAIGRTSGGKSDPLRYSGVDANAPVEAQLEQIYGNGE